MSTTLSKGYKLPTTADPGSSWFKDIEDNIQRTNDHKHNGLDGEKIEAVNLVRPISIIQASAWGSDLGGSTYKQTVTAPVSVTEVNDMSLRFVINTGSDAGTQIYPTVKRVSATTFDVTVNDNSLELRVVYG